MGDDWCEVELKDVATELTVGFVGSMTGEYVPSGIPFLRSKNVDPFNINTDDLKYISIEFHKKISKSRLSPGDVVIVRTGKPGTCSVVPSWLTEANCSDLVIVRCGPEINNRYLAYYINAVAHSHVNAHLVGAVQQHFNVGSAKTMKIKLPAINVQERIVEILGTLDDKVELNRQMNATLEAMAQALFKSWFVDFDPVIDNALAAGNPIPEELQPRADARTTLGGKRKPLPEAIQKQFPSLFVFCEEMGWVPEGWNLGFLSEIAELLTQSVHPNKEPDKEWAHFSIPAFDEGMWPSLDLGQTIKSGKYSVPSSCILASKLNPQFPRVWMPDVEDEAHSICSTEFMPFVPRNNSERAYLYSLFCSEVIQTEIANRVTGSTGSRQRVKPKEIAELPILIVPQNIREAFSLVAEPIFSKQLENRRTEVTLAKLRDTLLPKLLSGELRVPDAEKLAAEAV